MSNTQPNRRLRGLLWGLFVWTLVIAGRLVQLQVVEYEKYEKMARNQQEEEVHVPALRGAILDRNGQILARSIPAESVILNPFKIEHPAEAAEILARGMDMSEAAVTKQIAAAKAKKRQYLAIRRQLSADEAKRLRSVLAEMARSADPKKRAKWDEDDLLRSKEVKEWLEFEPESLRIYPHRSLAANVLGYIGDSGHGLGGIESKFDDVLAGEDGLIRNFKDMHGQVYRSEVLKQPKPGADVRLTIDSTLQFEAEHQLAEAARTSGAPKGSAIVMDPHTYEVLAMASYPTFDPNRPPASPKDLADRSNVAITEPFEPGSVFKTITLTAGLETTQLRPETMIDCGNGSITLFGRTIHDHARYSALRMEEVLWKSSNVGAIRVGLAVGREHMNEYIRRFGFATKTGIELPGESKGILRKLEKWQASSIGSIAMGHEVGATSIQLAVAGSVIANDGVRMTPRIVRSIHHPDGTEEIPAIQQGERVIRPETAHTMRLMMEGVVLSGTGKQAAVRGYTVGGKTGSAQIIDPVTKAYIHNYNASFLGFSPVVQPKVVVVITLRGTGHGEAGYGGAVAAPVFRQVTGAALRALSVPPDAPTKTPLKETSPELDDLPVAGLGQPPDLRDDDAPAVPAKALSAKIPVPEAKMADAPLPERKTEIVAENISRSAPRRNEIPEFRGLTLRGVLERSSETGLPVDVQGQGIARAQDPLPGTVLAPGARIRVMLAR